MSVPMFICKLIIGYLYFLTTRATSVNGWSVNNGYHHDLSRRDVFQTAAAIMGTTTAIRPSSATVGSTTTNDIPPVGYSFFKTAPEMAQQCTYLALQAGVQHLDVGTLYQSNEIIGLVLKDYITYGLPSLDSKGLPVEDGNTILRPSRKNLQKKRRDELFVTHKLANFEQSSNVQNVKESIYQQMKLLNLDYLNMVMIHSPLTDTKKRLSTYRALLELKQVDKIIQHIGVCNYGVNPLSEWDFSKKDN